MSIPDIDVYIPPAPLPHTIVPFPLYITVHLGAPDQEAINVTVPYLDYIKNVASSELYPTWPDEALKANIHAISSIAMNRIFTEWYRSQGYDFDITSTTQYDQAYVHGRGIFDNISDIVNEIFNEYIVRDGHIEPLFASFCDGRVSQCDGMYQWGSVDLAEQGYSALDILRYYYGDDINIVTENVAEEVTGTYPGEPLMLGDSGIYVFRMQHSLNRISDSFPLIPKIQVTGFFDESTENAVKIFQGVFNLPVTGIVDSSTWYRIRYIYIAVTSLSQLISEGITLEDLKKLYADIILEGGDRPLVVYIQFFLNIVSQEFPTIKPIEINRFFGPETTAALIEFQTLMGLNPTGVADQETLNYLYWTAYSILTSMPLQNIRIPILPYTFVDLVEGMGPIYPRILLLQLMLNTLSTAHPEIIAVEADGEFGPSTTAAVIAFQSLFGLPVTGIVDEDTWDKIVQVYQLYLMEQAEQNT